MPKLLQEDIDYHTLKQKIISDLRTSFQVGELQQSLQLPDPPQLHTASSTSSPALNVSKKKKKEIYCITLIKRASGASEAFSLVMK